MIKLSILVLIAFDSVPDQFVTGDVCDKIVSKDPLMIKYCHDKYMTQRMYDKVVQSCLLALKFVLDWLFTNKIIKKT